MRLKGLVDEDVRDIEKQIKQRKTEKVVAGLARSTLAFTGKIASKRLFCFVRKLINCYYWFMSWCSRHQDIKSKLRNGC